MNNLYVMMDDEYVNVNLKIDSFQEMDDNLFPIDYIDISNLIDKKKK